MMALSVTLLGDLRSGRFADENGVMQTRYVPVTAEGIEALSVAAAGVADGPIRQALSALVRAYESSTTGCLHGSVMRAGSSRKCNDCGSWL
jgi:hypothetical protein